MGEGEDDLHAMSTRSGYKRVGDPLWASGLKGPNDHVIMYSMAGRGHGYVVHGLKTN